MSTDVMTNPKTTTKEKKRISTKVIAQIGVLGAIAMVLMLFDIPLPFAPTFYKIDFSEVPVLIGAVFMTIVGCFINAYLLLPAYAAAFHMPIDALVAMGTAVNSHINSLLTFVLLSVAPFNLLKGFLVSLIVFLIYKKISPILQMGRE